MRNLFPRTSLGTVTSASSPNAGSAALRLPASTPSAADARSARNASNSTTATAPGRSPRFDALTTTEQAGEHTALLSSIDTNIVCPVYRRLLPHGELAVQDQIMTHELDSVADAAVACALQGDFKGYTALTMDLNAVHARDLAWRIAQYTATSMIERVEDAGLPCAREQATSMWRQVMLQQASARTGEV